MVPAYKLRNAWRATWHGPANRRVEHRHVKAEAQIVQLAKRVQEEGRVVGVPLHQSKAGGAGTHGTLEDGLHASKRKNSLSECRRNLALARNSWVGALGERKVGALSRPKRSFVQFLFDFPTSTYDCHCNITSNKLDVPIEIPGTN